MSTIIQWAIIGIILSFVLLVVGVPIAMVVGRLLKRSYEKTTK